jgi:hypothetical protein
MAIADVKRVHGVTYDGHSVWFAADDGDLVEVDPEAGAVRSKTPGFGCDAGMTFDGKSLWVICSDKINKVDPKTRKILASIPSPAPEQDSGMAWAEGALWIGQYQSKEIIKVDPETGRVLKRIKLDRLVTGVTWADGELWHGSIAEGDSRPGGLHKIDAESGAERDVIELEGAKGASGVEYDATRGVFWCGAHDVRKDKGAASPVKLRAVRKPR